MNATTTYTNKRLNRVYPWLSAIEDDPAIQYQHCLEAFDTLPEDELIIIIADTDLPQAWRQAAAQTLARREAAQENVYTLESERA
jgi:hypothetical protein